MVPLRAIQTAISYDAGLYESILHPRYERLPSAFTYSIQV